MTKTRGFLSIVLFSAAVSLAAPGTAHAANPPTFTMGRDVAVEAGEVSTGDLLVFRGDLDVRQGGVVDGDVAVAFGDAVIAGEVRGDVWASGDLTLTDTAVVLHDAAALGHIERAPGAQVGGEILIPRSERVAGAEVSLADVRESGSQGAAILAGLTLLLAAAFAALTTALLPGVIANVRDALARAPIRVFLLGLLATVLLPFVLFALLAVVPLVPVALLVWAVLLAVGGVGLAERIGQLLLGSHGGRSRRAAIGGFFVSIPLAVAVTSVPVLNDLGASGAQVLTVFACACALLLFLSLLAVGAALLALLGWRARPAPGAAGTEPAQATSAALPPLEGTGGVVPGESPRWEEAGAAAGPETEPLGSEWPAGSAAPTADVEAPEPPPAVVEPPEPLPVIIEPPEPSPAVVEPPEPLPVIIEPPEPSPAVAEPEEGVPEAEADVVSPPAAPEAPASADIRSVPGLSPIYAHLLREAGYRSVGDLAEASVDGLLAAVAMPGIQPVTPETAARWIAEARALSEP